MNALAFKKNNEGILCLQTGDRLLNPSVAKDVAEITRTLASDYMCRFLLSDDGRNIRSDKFLRIVGHLPEANQADVLTPDIVDTLAHKYHGGKTLKLISAFKNMELQRRVLSHSAVESLIAYDCSKQLLDLISKWRPADQAAAFTPELLEGLFSHIDASKAFKMVEKWSDADKNRLLTNNIKVKLQFCNSGRDAKEKSWFQPDFAIPKRTPNSPRPTIGGATPS